MIGLLPNDKQKEIIAKLRNAAEEERAKREAKKLGFPYINLALKPINIEELIILTEKESRKGSLAVLQKIGKKLRIGIRNPQNPETINILNALKEKGYLFDLFLISQKSLEKTWQRYKDYIPPLPPLKEILAIQKEELEIFKKTIKNIGGLKEKITAVSITELLSAIIAGAIKTESSDIHLEPTQDALRLRYRIDGFLQDITYFKKDNYNFLLARVKLLSKLKINIHDVGQDGRFTAQINEGQNVIQKIDIRVSIVPTGFGETIVMRLLGIAVKNLQLVELGIQGHVYKTLEREISKSNGIIFNTGPTGSGKTTTLYALLNFLNKPGAKIITIENPIEYKLEGITQTQVNFEKGYTFIEGLKSALRQDPDIIMIGEIRGKEEGETAIHAALTGHLVFSTLHTNSASDTIPRLVDIGIDKTILPSAINAIIAQRLVRRLCPKCKEKYQPDPKTIQAIKQTLSLISPKTSIPLPQEISFLYKAKGCPDCFGFGYRGQIGIFEIFTITDKMQKLILNGATSYELLAAAIEEGMVTLLQDGLLKTVSGVTTIEEIKRVAGDAQYIETLYGEAVSSLLTRSLEIKKDTQKKTKDAWFKKDKFTAKLSAAPQEYLLEWITSGAVWSRATDIHIEPQEKTFIIRYRIDGLLETISELPKNLFLSLVAQLKILCGLKTEVHKKIQEGRFNIQIEKEAESRDTRVSIIPGGYGESIVIRILQKGVEKLTMESLGLRPEYFKTIEQEITKPNGIILITGPTSAGKTTTLYAILNRVNRPGVKILTVEDPIEYRLPGITQTQVNEEEYYTFSNALRSFLRQNPNIMMIGEIRDQETADIAIRAALTGHLVLSTLHTNNALESIQRLSNIGLETRDIASALNMVIAQRLVRYLCPECKQEYKPTNEELKFVKIALGDKAPSPITLYKPRGCPNCGPTGFKGQIGIFEIFINDPDIQDLITKKASMQEIEAMVKNKGMMTIKQDGVLRALEGVTTLDEVRRVTE